MKKIVCAVGGCLTAIFFCGNAMAGYYAYIDNSNKDNVFDIYFVTDEAVALNGYQLDFGYDSTEMQWTGYTNTTPQPSSIIANFMGNATESSTGVIFNFNAFSFFGSDFSAAAGTTTKIGTLTFNIYESAVADGQSDLWINSTLTAGLNMADPNSADGTGYTFYRFMEDASLAQYGTGLDVGSSPVPVPGTGLLLGSTLLGLVGLRRKRRA